MIRCLLVGKTIATLWIGTAIAQVPQPYAGLQNRDIKTLSEEQMSDLRAGRGMGLALAAELNGYPGPRHVLELADDLHLTGQQLADIKKLFDEMTAEAVPLGAQLIDQERTLNALFVSQRVTQQSLGVALADIGKTQATLRNAHLKYHLLTAQLLSAGQISRYSELRGYGVSPHQHRHGHSCGN
jgi:hypothetical protein